MYCKTCGNEFKRFFHTQARCLGCGVMTLPSGKQPDPTIECVFCERTFSCTNDMVCPWCLNVPGYGMDAYVASAIKKHSLRVV